MKRRCRRSQASEPFSMQQKSFADAFFQWVMLMVFFRCLRKWLSASWLVGLKSFLFSCIRMCDYARLTTFLANFQLEKPGVTNARSLLEVILTLDSNPTRLSEGSIAALGDFLPVYMLDAVRVSIFCLSSVSWPLVPIEIWLSFTMKSMRLVLFF